MLLVLAGLFAMRDTYGRLGPGGLRVWIRMEGVRKGPIRFLGIDFRNSDNRNAADPWSVEERR